MLRTFYFCFLYLTWWQVCKQFLFYIVVNFDFHTHLLCVLGHKSTIDFKPFYKASVIWPMRSRERTTTHHILYGYLYLDILWTLATFLLLGKYLSIISDDNGIYNEHIYFLVAPVCQVRGFAAVFFFLPWLGITILVLLYDLATSIYYFILLHKMKVSIFTLLYCIWEERFFHIFKQRLHWNSYMFALCSIKLTAFQIGHHNSFLTQDESNVKVIVEVVINCDFNTPINKQQLKIRRTNLHIISPSRWIILTRFFFVLKTSDWKTTKLEYMKE